MKFARMKTHLLRLAGTCTPGTALVQPQSGTGRAYVLKDLLVTTKLEGKLDVSCTFGCPASATLCHHNF